MSELEKLLAEIRGRVKGRAPRVLDEEMFRVAYLNGGLGALVNEACCNYRGGLHGEYVANAVNDAAAIVARTDIPRLLALVDKLREQRDDYALQWSHADDAPFFEDILEKGDAECVSVLKGEK